MEWINLYATRWAFAQPLVGLERLALIEIARHSEQVNGSSWLSMATIASYLGVSVRHARRVVRSLERNRYVLTRSRPGQTTLVVVNSLGKPGFSGSNPGHPCPPSDMANPGHPCPPSPDTHVRGTPDTHVRRIKAVKKKNIKEKSVNFPPAFREQVPDDAFDSWFSPSSLVQLSSGEFVLRVPNDFYGAWIAKRYLAILESSLGSPVSISALSGAV